MHLAPYIETLLYERNFVILPGFGAFEPGVYLGVSLNDQGELLPPKRSITFNPYLSGPESLLAETIAKKELITLEDAETRLTNLVFEWKSTLNKGLALQVEGIGTFEKVSGVITLLDSSSEMSLGNFGLPAIAPPTKIIEAAAPQEVEIDEVRTEVTEVFEVNTSTTSIESENLEELSAPLSVANRLALLLAALAIVSFILFFYKHLSRVDLSQLFQL